MYKMRFFLIVSLIAMPALVASAVIDSTNKQLPNLRQITLMQKTWGDQTPENGIQVVAWFLNRSTNTVQVNHVYWGLAPGQYYDFQSLKVEMLEPGIVLFEAYGLTPGSHILWMPEVEGVVDDQSGQIMRLFVIYGIFVDIPESSRPRDSPQRKERGAIFRQAAKDFVSFGFRNPVEVFDTSSSARFYRAETQVPIKRDGRIHIIRDTRKNLFFGISLSPSYLSDK